MSTEPDPDALEADNVFTGLLTVMTDDQEVNAHLVWSTPTDLASMILEAFEQPVTNVVLALTKAHDPDVTLDQRSSDPRSES